MLTRTTYLSSENTEDFVSLHFPDLDSHDSKVKVAAFRSAIESGKRSDRDFILIYSDDVLIWSFLVSRQELDSFSVQCPKYPLPMSLPETTWIEAIALLKTRLMELGCKKALLRFIKSPNTIELSQSLAKSGFRKGLGRIEFKTPLSKLPYETESPFQWKPVDGTVLTLETAADIMKQCAAGDPNWDETVDVFELLKSDLAESGLYNSLDAIQIGYLNSKASAFVFAQANRATGWARLGYLGILPELRGKGLGKAVQLHGFSMMRSQGGVEYHGGTSDANMSMLGTFRSLGSELYREMEDWDYESSPNRS